MSERLCTKLLGRIEGQVRETLKFETPPYLFIFDLDARKI
jgi:hypothetical protein